MTPMKNWFLWQKEVHAIRKSMKVIGCHNESMKVIGCHNQNATDIKNNE